MGIKMTYTTFDGTETKKKYREYLERETGQPIVDGYCFEFDSTKEGYAAQELVMDQIEKDGCYGYGVSMKDGKRRLHLSELTFHAKGLKHYFKTLFYLDCLVVIEAEYNEPCEAAEKLQQTIDGAHQELIADLSGDAEAVFSGELEA
jgi:hypothetical protein